MACARLDAIDCKKAPFERDYLLPAPSNNYRGTQCRELRYNTVQTLCFGPEGCGSLTSRSDITGHFTERVTSFRVLPRSQATRHGEVPHHTDAKTRCQARTEQLFGRSSCGFDNFNSTGITKKQCSRSIRLLSNRRYAEEVRHPPAELPPPEQQLEEGLSLDTEQSLGASLPQGFYISTSSKKAIPTLHRGLDSAI